MATGIFKRVMPNVKENRLLREPQSEAYDAIAQHFRESDSREAAIVLPVGCGKSGLITLAPFATGAERVLVIAPGLRIAQQLADDFNPSLPSMFYKKCRVIDGSEYPEPAEIRGSDSNRDDLEAADVVITNIQQLQRDGAENKWLAGLPDSFFDLLIFDEGHHNVAESWDILRQKFAQARVISASATPTRSDGRLMAGHVVYAYPVHRAIQSGLVKRVKGIVLNPESLRYVRREDGRETEVSLEEVRSLGERDADFRRSIVNSHDSLVTIVDASIIELRRRRDAAQEQRLRIIASALNMEHCKQIVQAYRERGMRAEYIHSRVDSKANEVVLAKLARHELDVIVQVRMLGEGFDDPFLTVAAVFSIFANLSPFVQFVGRVMRVIKQNAPGEAINDASVVFHAGANTVKVWDDFKEFAAADQKWFALLTEEVPIAGESQREVDPTASMSSMHNLDSVRITEAGRVNLEELHLLSDARMREAVELLAEAGVTADEYERAVNQLSPIPVTRQARRRASRKALDEVVRTRAARLLRKHGLGMEAHDLDRRRLGRTNWVIVKAAIDNRSNAIVGKNVNERNEYSQDDIDAVTAKLDEIVADVERELFNG